MTPMTAEQYQEAKERSGLTHEKFGKLIGISRRQSQRYANGKTPVSKTVSLLVERLERDKHE